MAAFPPVYPYPNLHDWRGNTLAPGVHVIPRHLGNDGRPRPDGVLQRVEQRVGNVAALELETVVAPGRRAPLVAGHGQHLHVVELSHLCHYKNFLPWYQAFAAANVLLWTEYDLRSDYTILEAFMWLAPFDRQRATFKFSTRQAMEWPGAELESLRYFRETIIEAGVYIEACEPPATYFLPETGAWAPCTR